jgi:hypothetical protein
MKLMKDFDAHNVAAGVVRQGIRCIGQAPGRTLVNGNDPDIWNHLSACCEHRNVTVLHLCKGLPTLGQLHPSVDPGMAFDPHGNCCGRRLSSTPPLPLLVLLNMSTGSGATSERLTV